MTERNKEIIRQFVDQVINKGDLDSIGYFVHENYIEHVPLPGQKPGLEGLKDVLRGVREAFPDLYWEVKDQIAEGAKVVTWFEWTGTQKGEFMGVSATGKNVRVWGMVIDEFQGEKVKYTRLIMDSLGLMTQLGAVGTTAGKEGESA